MKRIKIADELTRVCPGVQLGCIMYSAKVEKENVELWKRINDIISEISTNMSLEDIGNEKNIKDSRDLYKKIGKDPHRYRISSEALIRRIIQGKGLYKVNNIVDANNLISIVSKFSVGSYDVDKLGKNLSFRIGKQGESYKGIGKDIINIENLPVFADENGPYGSPTSDSEKAMITNNTRKILTVLISFSGDSDLEKNMKEAVSILKDYIGVTDIETYICKGEIEREDER